MAVMSSFKQQCPSCEAMISIKESMIGKKVECTKCKDKFIAARPDDDDEADETPSPKKETKLGGKKNTAVKSGPPKSAAAGKRPKMEVDDEDEGKPTNGKSNGKPPKGRKNEPDEDEDEEEGTAKKKKKPAASSNKLIIGLGLAVVGIVILVVAAIFVMRDKTPKGPAGGGNPGGQQAGDLPADGGNPDFKPGPQKKPIERAPDAVALTDVELAKLSNLLPNDTEHVLHVFMKDLFSVNSPIREAVFQPGALDDADLRKRLGFSLHAIEDLIYCEKFTAPSWRYTVIRFKEVLQEAELKKALNMTAIPVEGQSCYKTLGAHPWFDTLARFSFGIPNRERYFDDRSRNRPSYVRVYNPQTLIIITGDEKPAMALLKANGQFKKAAPKAPVNPNPGGMMGGNPAAGMMGGIPAGMMGGGPPPMPGGMMGGIPAGMMGGGPPPMPGGMMGGIPAGMKGGGPPPMPGGMKGGGPPPPPPAPSAPGGTSSAPPPGTVDDAPESPKVSKQHFTVFQGGFVPPQVIQPAGGMKGGPPPQPMGMMGGIPAGMMGGEGMMGGAAMQGGGPVPPPPNQPPASAADEMYLTLKPGLKAILDRMELRGSDTKDKVLFSSATDMDANRIEIPDLKDSVVRLPRQFWDVTLLLYEPKPCIRNLGVALIQKETLKYQFRNELVCAQEGDAKGFERDLSGRVSQQVAKFIQNLVKHEVQLPSAAKTEEPPPVDGGVPPAVPPQDEKKPKDVAVSQITVEQEYNSVKFILDLVLDNPALMHVQAISSLAAGTLRVEMEAAASLSLRHGLAASGKLLGEKGLSERQVPPGTWPPGAFQRETDKRDIELRIDREPRNRISWMAGLLPHMGHQNLFNKLNFKQSWRDPGNWSAGNTIVPQFLDPTYPDYSRYLSVGDIPLDFAATHYVGIAGVGADAAYYRRGDPATAHKRGVLSYDGSATLEEVQKGRGLSNTILMIQVPHDDSAGVSAWIAGGGHTLRGVPEKNSIAPFVLSTDRDKKTINHQGKRGTYVLMTDGSVRFVDQNVKDEVFKAMATVGGPAPEKLDLDRNEHTPLIPPPEAKDKAPAKKPAVKPTPPKVEDDKKPAVGGANAEQVKAALQGVWIAKSAKIDGKDAPAEFLKELQTIFKGDTIVTLNQGKPEQCPYTIDVAKTPHHLEFKVPSENEPTLAIFELAGGELRVCTRLPGAPGGRPTAIASTPGSGAALIVFTKQ